ncbi:MAG: toll/interleukin-1 receptor domain-containing protein, partial [Candidatus Binatia bacterium]
MADIFISYANEDRESAAQLAQMLESVGWRVWWDRRIPAGRTWRAVLEDALREMRCMVVLWSASSVKSPWVTEEAEEARRLGITIVPVLIQAVEPPIGFRAIQAADLARWDGTAGDPAAQMFIGDLKTVLGAPPARTGQGGSNLETQKIDPRFSPSRRLGDHWLKLTIAAGVTALLLMGWHFWPEPRQKIGTPPPQVVEHHLETPPAPSLIGLVISGERHELKPSDTVKLRVTANYSDGKQQ